MDVLKKKCMKLAEAISRSKRLVVYTGAGISTSANIPDYRGPNGVWTLLDQVWKTRLPIQRFKNFRVYCCYSVLFSYVINFIYFCYYFYHRINFEIVQGKEIAACDLGLAQPTIAHMALFMLYKQGKISHIVSQNCDGLHLRFVSVVTLILKNQTNKGLKKTIFGIRILA